MTAPTATLAPQLEAAAGELFHWPQHDQTIARLWQAHGGAALEAVLDDPAASARARFVAAEVLFNNDFTFVGRHDGTALARVYAAALVGRFTGHANAWGLLWVNEDLGQVGGRFKMIGAAAVPVLRELLTDATVVEWYEGSEEATVGNAQRYRIKDMAAYYLARMHNVPIAFHADVAARDRAIAALRAQLDAP